MAQTNISDTETSMGNNQRETSPGSGEVVGSTFDPGTIFRLWHLRGPWTQESRKVAGLNPPAPRGAAEQGTVSTHDNKLISRLQIFEADDADLFS